MIFTLFLLCAYNVQNACAVAGAKTCVTAGEDCATDCGTFCLIAENVNLPVCATCLTESTPAEKCGSNKKSCLAECTDECTPTTSNGRQNADCDACTAGVTAAACSSAVIRCHEPCMEFCVLNPDDNACPCNSVGADSCTTAQTSCTATCAAFCSGDPTNNACPCAVAAEKSCYSTQTKCGATCTAWCLEHPYHVSCIADCPFDTKATACASPIKACKDDCVTLCDDDVAGACLACAAAANKACDGTQDKCKELCTEQCGAGTSTATAACPTNVCGEEGPYACVDQSGDCSDNCDSWCALHPYHALCQPCPDDLDTPELLCVSTIPACYPKCLAACADAADPPDECDPCDAGSGSICAPTTASVSCDVECAATCSVTSGSKTGCPSNCTLEATDPRLVLQNGDECSTLKNGFCTGQGAGVGTPYCATCNTTETTAATRSLACSSQKVACASHCATECDDPTGKTYCTACAVAEAACTSDQLRCREACTEFCAANPTNAKCANRVDCTAGPCDAAKAGKCDLECGVFCTDTTNAATDLCKACDKTDAEACASTVRKCKAVCDAYCATGDNSDLEECGGEGGAFSVVLSLFVLLIALL